MYLELNQASDYFQVNIRLLVKAAKKEGLHLHLVFEGHAYQSITFNLNHHGPIFEKLSVYMYCFAFKDDRYVTYRTHLDLNEAIDAEGITKNLQALFNDHPLSFDNSKDYQFSFHKLPESHVDDGLLNVELNELTDFFRSRFLIDAPKKMLHDCDLRRGLVFQAYWDEKHTLQFVTHSYFGLRAKVRTPQVFFNCEYNGNSLHEFRLLPIRQHLQPYWKKRCEELELHKLPSCIILSSLALMKFSIALVDALKFDNELIWDWLNEIDHETNYPLKGLAIHQIDEDHPLTSIFNEFFKIREHKLGSIDTSLENLLNAREWITEDALFIQDLHLKVDGAHFWATNIGSILLMSRESEHKLLKGQIEFKVDGETLQGAQCSSHRHWFFPFDEPEPYHCPQFAILNSMDISRRSTPS